MAEVVLEVIVEDVALTEVEEEVSFSFVLVFFRFVPFVFHRCVMLKFRWFRW